MPTLARLNEGFLQRVIARVRAVVGCNIAYGLSHGGLHPEDAYPTRSRDKLGRPACDCSGFAAWGQFRARVVGGLWYDTTRIASDATGSQRLYVQTQFPVPGGLVVYPDYTDSKGKHHEGHVAVIVEEDGAKDVLRIVDCASTPSKLTGKAISERDGRFMLKKKGVVFCVSRDAL